MSSSGPSVSIRGLSKSYRILHNDVRHTRISEALVDWLRHPIRRPSRETFFALRDVTFDVPAGQIVGIIGRNGAGKSTLLKILSRITPPSSGEAVLHGRVGSLLEVGSGFHRELTGRENIFLNGAILGMKRWEIRKIFDDIVEFADVRQFVDTPVKRYSSGMYTRLAFAVAAHLRSEILIVDEVLAVGDMEFQKKCLGKMKDVATSGRTILFVSHNMHAVSVLCQRGIVLRHGSVIYDGDPRTAIETHLNQSAADDQDGALADTRPGTGEYRFVWARPTCEMFAPEEEKVIHFRIERRKSAVLNGFLAGRLTNEAGAVIAQFDSRLVRHELQNGPVLEGTLSFRGPWLKPGTYRLRLIICPAAGMGKPVDVFEDACSITVSPILPYAGSGSADSISQAAVLADFQWTTGVPVEDSEVVLA